MTEKEYHLILAELGILDDDEDWELYKEQEKRFVLTDEECDILMEYENDTRKRN